jgi:vacuolar protein sorting-associated protein 54
MDSKEEPNVNEVLKQNVLKKQKSTPKIMFNNILSSILNDPRASVPTWTEKTKSPPPPSNTPAISFQTFVPYLDSIREPYQQFLIYQNEEKQEDERQQSKSSKESLSSSVISKEIPQIFISRHFDLTNPEVFHTALETSSYIVLQEKLSHYLDLVELELVKHVSKRTDSFFKALRNVRELQQEVRVACQQIDSLRKQLNEIDEEMVKKALYIVQLRNRRQNLLNILDKLHLMAAVWHVRPTIESLINNNDYSNAMDLITTAKDIVTNQLDGIQILTNMRSYLQKIQKTLIRKMIDEFVRLSERDIESERDTLGMLTQILTELIACDKLPKALQFYKESVQQKIDC